MSKNYLYNCTGKGLIVGIALSFGLAFLSDSALANGNFSGTCRDLSLVIYRRSAGFRVDATYLRAICTKANGLFVRSSINLDRYIGNRGGNLVWARNGNFTRTCIRRYFGLNPTPDQIGVDPVLLGGQDRFGSNPSTPPEVVASCLTGKVGEPKRSRINLDERIANRNGRLVYIEAPVGRPVK